MSKYKNAIVFVNEGFLPPEEAISKATEEFKSSIGFGAALTSEDPETKESTQELDCWSESEDFPSVRLIMEQFKTYEKDGCMMVLGDYPKIFDADSEQPHVILRLDDEDPESPILLIAGISGEFNCGGPDDDPAAVVADILRGSLARFLKTSEDLDDMMEKIISDEALPKMVKSLAKGDYTICLLAENGVEHIFGGEKMVKFDWGWMSESCGYGEKKETVVQKVVTAARSFGSKGKKEGLPVSTETAAGSLQDTSKANATSTSEKSGTGDNTGDAAYIMVAAPLGSKEEVRNFYKRVNNGNVPTSYKNRPEVKVLRTTREKVAKQFGYGEFAKPIAGVEPVVSSNTETTIEVIPKAPPAELAKLKDVFSKRPTVVKITNEGRGIIDPKRIEETEKEFATYPEMKGHKSIMDVYAYDFPDFLDLAKNTPHIAAILMTNLVSECVRRTPAVELNPPVEEEDKKPVAASGGVRRFGNKK